MFEFLDFVEYYMARYNRYPTIGETYEVLSEKVDHSIVDMILKLVRQDGYEKTVKRMIELEAKLNA